MHKQFQPAPDRSTPPNPVTCSNVIRLHRVVELPVRTLDDIVRENRDAWPYDESECAEDMRPSRLSRIVTIFCLAVAAWCVVYLAMQGFRAVFL